MECTEMLNCAHTYYRVTTLFDVNALIIHKYTPTHSHPSRCLKIPLPLVILTLIFSIQLTLMEIAAIHAFLCDLDGMTIVVLYRMNT